MKQYTRLSAKHADVMRYLETVEEGTIEQIYRNVPWAYYSNENKHMGAMLATMVRRGLIERVKQGVFRVKRTRREQGDEGTKHGEMNWNNVKDALPATLETVWLTNGKWVALGCLVETDDGWHWAESNGVIYSKNGKIVSECESEDLDVTHWHSLPKLPNT